MTGPKREVARTSGIAVAALLLAASQLLSRLLGLAREMVLAGMVGPGREVDAYVAAFTIPEWLNYMLAGTAFSLVFVPIYSKLRAEDDGEGADRFFGTVLGVLGVAVTLGTLLLLLFAPQLVDLVFGEFDEATRANTVHLTRIVLPAQICFVVGGVIKGALLARGRFGAAAAVPVVYNLFIILGGVALSPFIGVEGFAWGVLAGAFVGAFLIPLLDALRRVRFSLHFSLRDPIFLRYLWLSLPLMLGISLMTVDEWYEKIFGAALASGTVGHLSFARKVMQVPVGLIGQSLGAAALPALAQLWAEGKLERLNRAVATIVRVSLSMGISGAVFCFLFATQIVTLIYQRGAFSEADSRAVAAIFAVLALALPAWLVQQTATRGFYARSDTWKPMLVGTAVTIAVIPLYLWMRELAGAVGLAWAGAIGMSVSALATVLLLRFLHAAPRLLPLLYTVGSALLVSVPAGAAAFYAATWIGDRLPEGMVLLRVIVELMSGGVLFALLSVIGLLVIGDPDTRDNLRRLLRRRRN